jgi:hypothetical protein
MAESAHHEHERETVYAVPEFWVITLFGQLARSNACPTEEAALEAIKALTDARGYDVGWRASRATWQHREALAELKFSPAAPDKLDKPVWRHLPFWDDLRNRHASHHVRVSKDTPGMLAYYQTPEKACRGIRTKIRPARYLMKYFSDVLTEKQCAAYGKWQETGALENSYDDAKAYEMAFATTAEDIRRVYENGPHSCMSHRASDFRCDGHHPAEAYAAGNLAIAYLTETATGSIRARALVWPEKLALGRVYPTPDNYQKDGFADQTDAEAMQTALKNRLRKLGYDDKPDGFSGAKLQRIALDGSDDRFLMPYLDHGYGVTDGGDDYFRMRRRNYDYTGDSTGGYITIQDDGTACDRCGDRVDDDETYAVATCAHSGGGAGWQMWCAYCADTHSFRCEGFEETFSDRVPSVEVDGSDYTLRYAEENFTQCDRTGNWFDGGGVTMVDGETWSPDAFEAQGFVCAVSGENVPIDQAHPDHPTVWRDCDLDSLADWLDQQRIYYVAEIELPEPETPA